MTECTYITSIICIYIYIYFFLKKEVFKLELRPELENVIINRYPDRISFTVTTVPSISSKKFLMRFFPFISDRVLEYTWHIYQHNKF